MCIRDSVKCVKCVRCVSQIFHFDSNGQGCITEGWEKKDMHRVLPVLLFKKMPQKRFLGVGKKTCQGYYLCCFHFRGGKKNHFLAIMQPWWLQTQKMVPHNSNKDKNRFFQIAWTTRVTPVPVHFWKKSKISIGCILLIRRPLCMILHSVKICGYFLGAMWH